VDRHGGGGAFSDRLVAANADTLQVPVDNLLPISTYYRTLTVLDRQISAYRAESNVEQLYVMLHRYASLLVDTIPKHKNFAKTDAAYILHRHKVINTIMPELERLKLELNLRAGYISDDDSHKRFMDAPFSPKNLPGTTMLSSGALPQLKNWGSSSSSIDNNSNSSKGDVLAFLNLPSDDSSSTVVATVLPDIPTTRLPGRTSPASATALNRHTVLPPSPSQPPPSSFNQQQAPRPPPPPPPPPPPSSSVNNKATTNYPSLIESQLASLQVTQPPPPSHPQPHPYAELQLGPQEYPLINVRPPMGPPDPNDTCCTPLPPSSYTSTTGDNNNYNNMAIAPAVGVPEVRKRERLRHIQISIGLMDEFLRYATHNTMSNIETCAILAGTLAPNDATFYITSLIIPKQKGTSDQVEMLNEEEIFEAQDSRSLYPLGWIHTHPSQTCFLSSIDIHTQFGYQVMLDEAVAIVMAPRDQRHRVGIFRLTTPGGMELIQRCDERGFHAHPPTATGQPVYDLCRHVYLNPRIKSEVIDLR
jgi:STAM-binding protein